MIRILNRYTGKIIRIVGTDNLSGANLYKADLFMANLCETNLCEADLSKAYLRGANLFMADLSRANLRWADLSGANLRWADLEGAALRGVDLEGANLEGADLEGANMEGTNLEGANLEGANLRDTCLDPMHKANADVTGYETQTTRNGETWCVGYRTRKSVCVGSATYEAGTVHEAPVFSVADKDCHPGLYVFPTPEDVYSWCVKNETDCPGIVRVWFRAVDCHRAGEKWRVRWFVVSEDV